MTGAKEDLQRGREAHARSAWSSAYEALSAADRASELEGKDLELRATSAYMLGREDEYLMLLERAHHAHLDAGATLQAVRCAFWVGLDLLLRSETARATGWFGRAGRHARSRGG